MNKERIIEHFSDAKTRMMGQVKWIACDCGCERDTPADAASVAWVRAAQQLDRLLNNILEEINERN